MEAQGLNSGLQRRASLEVIEWDSHFWLSSDDRSAIVHCHPRADRDVGLEPSLVTKRDDGVDARGAARRKKARGGLRANHYGCKVY